MAMKNDTYVARSPWGSVSAMLKRRIVGWVVSTQSRHRLSRFVVLPGDVVSDEIIATGLYEETVLAALFESFLVPRLPDFREGVAVDVGANIGNHSLFLQRYFASVVAFEPNPDAVALLRCNVALSAVGSIEVIPFGLGDREATLEFHQDEQGNLGGSGFGFAGVVGGKHRECRICRGDDILTTTLLHGRKISLIKLDVEGAEFAALQGLTRVLREHRPLILFELHRAGGDSGGRAIFSLLRDLGYGSFFALDEAAALRPGRWRKLAYRLLFGERVVFLQLDTPLDRFYQLIAALPSDL